MNDKAFPGSCVAVEYNEVIEMSWKSTYRNPLAVQWLGFCAFTAEGPAPIPAWEH